MADYEYQIKIASQLAGERQTTAGLRNLMQTLTATGVHAAHFVTVIGNAWATLGAAKDPTKGAAKELAQLGGKFDSLKASANKVPKTLAQTIVDTGNFRQVPAIPNIAKKQSNTTWHAGSRPGKGFTELMPAKKAQEIAAKYSDAAAKIAAAVRKASAAQQKLTIPQAPAYINGLNTARATMEGYCTSLDKVAEKQKYANYENKCLSGGVGNIGKATLRSRYSLGQLSKDFTGVGKAAKILGNPIAGVTLKFGELAGIMDAGGAAGIYGVAVVGALSLYSAMLKLAAAGGAAYLSLAKFALQADKKSMERITTAVVKAKENINGLFKNVRTSQFADAIEDILSIFDRTTLEAGMLRFILSDLLNPLFDQSAAVGPIVKNLFRGMILGVLEMELAIMKAATWLKKFIPPSLVQDTNNATDALEVGRVAVKALTAAFAALSILVVGLLAIMALVFLTAHLPVLTLIAAILVLYLAVKALCNVFKEPGKAMEDFGKSAATAAGSAITGFVNGIKEKAGEANSAVAALSKGIIDSFSAPLEFGSPSKVFARFGVRTATGYSTAIDKSLPMVENAVSGMAEAAIRSGETLDDVDESLPLGGPLRVEDTRSQTADSNTTTTIDLRGAVFNFGAGADGKRAASDFISQLQSWIDAEVIMAGGTL